MPRPRGARDKHHSQRGISMGTCPDCNTTLWSTQQTIVSPVKVAGKWHAVIVHERCPTEVED